MSPEFRAGEQPLADDTVCAECGGSADAYASFDDGSGWVCRRCCERDEREQLHALSFEELYDYAFGPALPQVATEACAMVDDWFEEHGR